MSRRGRAEGWLRRVASGRPEGPVIAALRHLLAPAAGLYGLGAWLDGLPWDLGWRRPDRLACPVVGVGNLSAGGTGKTPLVMAVVKALGELGLPAGVVSRGYGGSAGPGVRWVSRGEGPLVPWTEAGDEPVLMARRLRVPVVVCPDRARAGRELIAQAGPRVVVGDDLFQHRRLHRDLDLVALDASHPLEGGLLPRGRLREPLSGLRRAKALVLTRATDPEAMAATRRWLRTVWGDGPILACRHRLAGLSDPSGAALDAAEWSGARVLAFCGLARPSGLAEGLGELGLEVAGLRAFADHHPFRPAELAGLGQEARRLRATALVCSEKDAVRIPLDSDLGLPLWVTRLELEWLDEGPDLAEVLAWGLSSWRAD